MNAAYATPEKIIRWLEARRLAIGSSDAAPVAGICRYRTALDVYVDKVYPIEPTGLLPEDPAMRWGLLLEVAVARGYELETGCKLAEPEPAFHREHAFIAATADRIRDDGRLVEIKTASAHNAGQWGESGTDEIPDNYLVQVQHQMAVYDAPAADVAVLIGGVDFRIYTIERSDPAIEAIIIMERDFWAMVERREPPEPDWSHAGTPDLINKLYRPTPGVIAELPETCLTDLDIFNQCGAELKDLESERKIRKAKLIEAMGDAETALLNGHKITRREVTRKAYTVNESTYTDFRVSKSKGECIRVP